VCPPGPKEARPMRPYEVMVIYDAELEESAVRASVDQSREQLASKGAELGPVDYWGKRRFAYRLKHRWEGYYVVLQAKAEPAAMDELHRVLSLADEVLRHKILRIPEAVYGKLAGTRPAPVPEVTAPEPGAEAVEADTSEPVATEGSEADAGGEDEAAPAPTGVEAPAGVDGGGA
jgi:small subunit ribosomal protein S6